MVIYLGKIIKDIKKIDQDQDKLIFLKKNIHQILNLRNILVNHLKGDVTIMIDLKSMIKIELKEDKDTKDNVIDKDKKSHKRDLSYKENNQLKMIVKRDKNMSLLTKIKKIRTLDYRTPILINKI